MKKHNLLLEICIMFFAILAGCCLFFSIANSATVGTTVKEQDIGAVKLVDENLVKYGNKTIDNKMRVVNTPYYTEISKGNVAGHAKVMVLGIQTATILNTHTDLNELGVNTTPLPATATIMEIISTSAQDGVAGTGALTIEVYGLSATYAAQNEIITTNGITAVSTTKSYIRINGAYVGTAGSGGSAAGIISIQATGGGIEYSRISVGHTQAKQAMYTVPLGQQALVLGFTAGTVVGKDTSVFWQATADPVDFDRHAGIFYIHDEFVFKDAGQSRKYQLPPLLPEKTDIKITAESLDSSGGYVSGGLELYIEAN